MTARHKRAVQVTPGTSLGRPEIVQGSLRSVTVSLGESRVRDLPLGDVSLAGSLPGSGAPPKAGSTLPRDSLGPAGVTKLERRADSRGVTLHVRQLWSPPFRHDYALLYVLEQHRGVLEILTLLHREGPATPSHMRRRLRPAQKALDSSLLTLRTAGLVERVATRGFPFSTVYSLTARGKSLVESPMTSWMVILGA